LNRTERWAALTWTVETAEKKFGMLSSSLAQKLFYLLQEAGGAPLGYKFLMYTSGPYCSELWGDLDALDQMGCLLLKPGRYGCGYEIRTTGFGRNLVARHLASVSGFKEKAELILDLAGGSATGLKALAFAFYVAKDRIAGKSDVPDAEVIAGVQKLAPRLDPDEISAALRNLKVLLASEISVGQR